MKLGGGLVLVAVVNGEETLYSRALACPDCGISVPQLEPRSFSFNSAYGACPECHGLGSRYDFDPAKVIVDWSKPLARWRTRAGFGVAKSDSQDCRCVAAGVWHRSRHAVRKVPGEDSELAALWRAGRGGKTGFRGILGYLKQNLEESTSESYRDYLMDYMSATRVPGRATGKRLRPESLAVKVNGMSIADFTALPDRARAGSGAQD